MFRKPQNWPNCENLKNKEILYTRYTIVARALRLRLAAYRPSARASKGILHIQKEGQNCLKTCLND